MQNRSVFCIVRDREQLESIAESIAKMELGNDPLSVLMPDPIVVRTGSREKPPATREAEARPGVRNRLAGFRRVLVPGFGACLAKGPLAVALTAATLGNTSQGIASVLTGMGIEAREAGRFEDKIGEGNIFIAIHTQGEADSLGKVKELLENQLAEYLSAAVESSARRDREPAQDPTFYEQ